jgi:hypothetical protein
MRRLLLIMLLCVSLEQAFGWGNEGHQAINRTAASRIPHSMPGFLRQAGARLEYLGPEPDRWKRPQDLFVKNAQEPDHFIDLERVAWMGPLPQGRYLFYRALYEKRAAMLAQTRPGADQHVGDQHGHDLGVTNLRPDDLLPERVGLQPYITMEIYDRLRVAFREYRRMKAAHQKTGPVEQNIVFYMGWLGHYVGDASNPMHTSIHYNGWVGPNPHHYTAEHKIHWQMEGEFVAHNLAQLQFANMVNAPVKLENPWQDYQKYLRASNGLVERCYQLEQRQGFTGEGTEESREFIRQRMAAGAQMLVNLWYTAWIESEKEPETTGFE